jgi:hypothetical protein
VWREKRKGGKKQKFHICLFTTFIEMLFAIVPVNQLNGVSAL